MDSHLASFSIFPATSDQVLESQRRRHKIWGNDMTEEEYIQVDQEHANSSYGRDGRLRTWVLAPRDDPETLDFMSSCRTFLRMAVIRRAQDSSDAPLPVSKQPVPCYAVASVCTPLQYRGRGYARRLMCLLHWVLAPQTYLDPATFPKEWGSLPSIGIATNDAQFSVLYSDIGRVFYATCGPRPDDEGWVIREVGTTVVWDVINMDIVDKPTSISSSSGSSNSTRSWSAKWLFERDIHDLLLRDDDFLTKSDQLNRRLNTKKDRHVSFSFLPSNIEGFLRDRQRMFSSKEDPRIERWGVVYTRASTSNASTTDIDVLAFATWAFEVKPSSPRTLVVTCLRIPLDADGTDSRAANSLLETELTRLSFLRDLLHHIFNVAKEHKMEKIEVWDVPEEILGLGVIQESGGRVIEREEHLSAFKWYGEERSEEVEWVNNERFAWC